MIKRLNLARLFQNRPIRQLPDRAARCDGAGNAGFGSGFCGTISGRRQYTCIQMRRARSELRWTCGLAFIVLANGIGVSLHAQQPTRLSPKVDATFNAPPVELKDDDSPILRLKKEQFNAALAEAKARSDLYNRGLTRVPELIEVAERLFRAQLDLYDQPEQKIQVLEKHLDVYNEAEATLEKQVKAGMVTQADLERLRYNKISVEIDLLNTKNSQESGASKAQPTPQ